MHSHVVSSGLGVSVSCCRGLRDSWPSVSGNDAYSLTEGVPHLPVVGSKIFEDSKCRSSKSVQQRLPFLRISRSYPLEQTRLLTALSDSEARSTIFQREILLASQSVSLLQSVLARYFPANLPSWTAKFPTATSTQWLIISILTSSLYLCTPTADAFEFFTPKGAGNENTVSRNDAQDGEAFRARVSLAIDLLEKGQNAQAQGDFRKALDFYEEVKQTAGDLALAEYARVGHAVALYEVGDRNEAITEMEDVSIALRGYPEIHAALAAALYVDKHAPMPAEKQFNIATLLDPRYTNVKWVEETKHWPPSLINSLKRFISLQ